MVRAVRGKRDRRHWLWHVNFYSVPDYPELLITGRELPYFSHFLRNECYDPSALTQV